MRLTYIQEHIIISWKWHSKKSNASVVMYIYTCHVLLLRLDRSEAVRTSYNVLLMTLRVSKGYFSTWICSSRTCITASADRTKDIDDSKHPKSRGSTTWWASPLPIHTHTRACAHVGLGRGESLLALLATRCTGLKCSSVQCQVHWRQTRCGIVVCCTVLCRAGALNCTRKFTGSRSWTSSCPLYCRQ